MKLKARIKKDGSVEINRAANTPLANFTPEAIALRRAAVALSQPLEGPDDGSRNQALLEAAVAYAAVALHEASGYERTEMEVLRDATRIQAMVDADIANFRRKYPPKKKTRRS